MITFQLIPSIDLDAAHGLSPCLELRAKELMLNKIGERLSIARVAKACGLSRSHFSRAFKKSTGMSPKDWFMRERLNTAAGLLASTELSISQISLACGFADQSHFTRAFSAKKSMTPLKWRKSALASAGL